MASTMSFYIITIELSGIMLILSVIIAHGNMPSKCMYKHTYIRTTGKEKLFKHKK
ncbi:hypothetical protein HMPREF3190_01468, partial [Umbribacter vaginalis]